MPKFAVYYVPRQTDRLYRAGSAILGYDLRRRGAPRIPADLSALVRSRDPDWARCACDYGLHMIIGHSWEADRRQVPQIEQMTKAIWRVFPRDTRFILIRKGRSAVRFWGQRREIVVMEFTPNSSLIILHTLVTAFFTAATQEPFRFKPHFTLLNPYQGSRRSTFVRGLSRAGRLRRMLGKTLER